MLHNNQFGQNDICGQTNLTSTDQVNLQNNVNTPKAQRQTLNSSFNIPEYSYVSNMNANLTHNLHPIGITQQYMAQNPLRFPINLNVPCEAPVDKRSFHKETTFLNVPKFKHSDDNINNYQQYNSSALYPGSHLDNNNDNLTNKFPNTCGLNQYFERNLDLTVKLPQRDENSIQNDKSQLEKDKLKDCVQSENLSLKPYPDSNINSNTCISEINVKQVHDNIKTGDIVDRVNSEDLNVKNESHFTVKSYKDADSRKRSLEKTLRMLEISIINSTNSRNIAKPDDTSLKPSLSIDNQDSIEIKDNESLRNENTSNGGSEKYVLHKTASHINNTLSCESKVENIKIKVEALRNLSDTNVEDPFIKDRFGVKKEDLINHDIHDPENSQNVAYELIRSGLSSELYFECPDCNLYFNNPKRYIIHVKWHSFGLTNEKRLELQRHKEMRKQIKKDARLEKKQQTDDAKETEEHTCKLCNKSYSTYAKLKNHRHKKHPSRSRDCKVCGLRFSGWVAMKAHLATHTGADTGFACPDCPKRFKHAHSLAKHRDTHKEKTQACPQCPKKFGSMTLLNIHMKTHERMRRGATFRCTYCGKGYFESFSLAAHERTHRNEKPFQCEICNTCFGTNSSLKRHLKVSHSTTKPFVCSTCHRSFVTEAIRDRHQLRFHGKPEDFKYPCSLCPSKYFELKDLKKHLYKVHPKVKRKKTTDSDCSDE